MTETTDKIINCDCDGMLEEEKPPKNLPVDEAAAEAYFQLLNDKKIMSFLHKDRFNKIADKYLLAIVFIYLKRGGLKIQEFNRQNFFLSLYLAHDIEEDTEIPKMTMLAWVLGKNIKEKKRNFLRKRDKLLQQMDYRAIVSKSECDKLMAKHNPTHWAWLRYRSEQPESAVESQETATEEKNTSSPSSQGTGNEKQHPKKRKEMDEVTDNSPAVKKQKTCS